FPDLVNSFSGTRKCGRLAREVRRSETADDQQCMMKRIELRLINNANPAIVAMIDDRGSIVSGEKYAKRESMAYMAAASKRNERIMQAGIAQSFSWVRMVRVMGRQRRPARGESPDHAVARSSRDRNAGCDNSGKSRETSATPAAEGVDSRPERHVEA